MTRPQLAHDDLIDIDTRREAAGLADLVADVTINPGRNVLAALAALVHVFEACCICLGVDEMETFTQIMDARLAGDMDLDETDPAANGRFVFRETGTKH